MQIDSLDKFFNSFIICSAGFPYCEIPEIKYTIVIRFMESLQYEDKFKHLTFP